MPNSLKSKLKKLVYQGHLTEKDLSRLYTDNDVIKELEKLKAETDALFSKSIKMFIEDNETEKAYLEEMDLKCFVKIIDKRISELKQE